MFVIGILVSGKMTNCTDATSDLKEAISIAKQQKKNVYEHIKGIYYLRKILSK